MSDDTDVAARLAEALAKASPAIYGLWPHGATDQPNDLGVDLATALLPVVRDLQAAEADYTVELLQRAEVIAGPTMPDWVLRQFHGLRDEVRDRAAALRGEAGP